MKLVHHPGCPSPWMCLCTPLVIEDTTPVLHDAHVKDWEWYMELLDQSIQDERYD